MPTSPSSVTLSPNAPAVVPLSSTAAAKPPTSAVVNALFTPAVRSVSMHLGRSVSEPIVTSGSVIAEDAEEVVTRFLHVGRGWIVDSAARLELGRLMFHSLFKVSWRTFVTWQYSNF